MRTLTKKEKIILEGIQSLFSKEGKMPTIRELQEEVRKFGLKVKSPRSILLYLHSLEEKGFIKRNRKSRGIKIMDKFSKNFVDIPILGMANTGKPTLYAEENLEGFLKVSKNIVRNRKLFAIQVKGTSMNLCKINDKKIKDNDYVIVDPNDRDFRDRDKVLVVIDGLGTVKLYKKLDGDKIGLFPMSTDKTHKPIYLTPSDETIICGKVIDVFKNVGSVRDSEYSIEYLE